MSSFVDDVFVVSHHHSCHRSLISNKNGAVRAIMSSTSTKTEDERRVRPLLRQRYRETIGSLLRVSSGQLPNGTFKWDRSAVAPAGSDLAEVCHQDQRKNILADDVSLVFCR